MEQAQAKAGRNKPERKPYLTKRILISASKQGFKKAAEETMQIMGYNVIAKDGWIVKIFLDVSIEKITQIEQENVNNYFALD